MKTPIRNLLVLLLMAISFAGAPAAEFDAKRLEAIVVGFDDRENDEGKVYSVTAHKAWIKTEAGKADAAWLAEHYDRIHSTTRSDMVMELARTGEVEIVPFINKALEHPVDRERALSGIFYGCHLADGTTAYRRGLAEAVARLCRVKFSKQKSAVELLPYLDSELAARTLITDEFLAPEAEFVVEVLAGLNGALITIPVERLESLMALWQPLSKDPGSKYRYRRGYCEAVRGLAAHDPKRAVALATEAEKLDRSNGDIWARVILAAEGLAGLDSAIGRQAQSHASFRRAAGASAAPLRHQLL